MSQHWSLGKAKKITLIIEDEQGMTYQINFGDEDRPVRYESAMNMDYQQSFNGGYSPAFVHATRREFNLKIHV